MGANSAQRSQVAAQQEAAQNAQIAAPQPAAAAAPAAPTVVDEAAEIQKYANLKAQGLITEEEFTAKKKLILGI